MIDALRAGVYKPPLVAYDGTTNRTTKEHDMPNIATTAEDLAYIAWMESLPGYADQAERIAQEAYTAWASDRRDDGMDDSEEAYLEYLEGFLPED